MHLKLLYAIFLNLYKSKYLSSGNGLNSALCVSPVMHEIIKLWIHEIKVFIPCFPVGYREISVKTFFDLTLVPPLKIPILMFLLPRLIARASNQMEI